MTFIQGALISIALVSARQEGSQQFSLPRVGLGGWFATGEEEMNAVRKPTEAVAENAWVSERVFSPDAYAYDDDVTPQAVEQMRALAAPTVDGVEWEVVDGFGFVFSTMASDAAVSA